MQSLEDTMTQQLPLFNRGKEITDPEELPLLTAKAMDRGAVPSPEKTKETIPPKGTLGKLYKSGIFC